MKTRTLAFGTLFVATLAGLALGQPTLTSLGTGTPLGVSNPQGGTVYIGGAGGTGTANVTRWALNGAGLTLSDAGTPGNGYISADGRYLATSILNGPTRFAIGNSATGVSPAFLAPGYAVPTLVPSSTQPGATEFGGARWDATTSTLLNMGVPGIIAYTPNSSGLGNSGVFGPSSSGQSTGNFLTPNAISANGRYILALAYVSSYNQNGTLGTATGPGTNISANSFYWRPVVWDSQANAGAGAMTVLPTPFRTASAAASTRRRTGNPYAISDDGLVIVGAQEHNASTGVSADPDGGRIVIWNYNTATSNWGMTYLPNGKAYTRAQVGDTPALVGPLTSSSTPGSYRMNAAGTIIVGRAITDQITTTLGTSGTGDDIVTGGTPFIGKWTWNAGTSSWDGPVSINVNNMAAASWLPSSVTSCGAPPNISVNGMSDDGRIVVGTATYSTCGSFMAGGWIWTDPSVAGGTAGEIVDWYDYLVTLGVPGVTADYGPTGDNGDTTRGLPKIGFPSAISPDGSVIVGFQGGNQRIIGAVPWALRQSSASACVGATIVSNPAASFNFSRCSTPILNVAASGTLPITYQWYKDGSPLTDGTTPAGGTVVGANASQLRLNNAKAGDAGSYYCVATGPCGTPAQSTATAVQLDPTVTLSNDLFATALPVEEGTFNYNACGAFVEDPNFGPSTCTFAVTTGDVWYNYTPTFTGDARIETCGAAFDTIVTVYAQDGSEIACNDDYLTGPSASCSSSRSRVARLPVVQGVPVSIRIVVKSSSIFSNVGQVRILQAPAAAAGDLCESPIPAVLGANAFDTTEATNSGDNASCNLVTNLNTRDVWFSYTPAYNGTVRASTCPGTSFNTVLSIYTGCGGGDIACSDDVAAGVCGTGTSTQSVISNFPVTGGTTYLFRVAGKTLGTFGAGTFTLAYTATPCGLSDIAGPGQSIGADGQLTADDIIVYLNWFFASDLRADVAGPGQSTTPDGQFTADDIIVFLNRFFAGC